MAGDSNAISAVNEILAIYRAARAAGKSPTWQELTDKLNAKKKNEPASTSSIMGDSTEQMARQQ